MEKVNVKGLVIRHRIQEYLNNRKEGATLKDIMTDLNLTKGQAEHHTKLLRQLMMIKVQTNSDMGSNALIYSAKQAKKKTGPKKEEVIHKPFSVKDVFATLKGLFK